MKSPADENAPRSGDFAEAISRLLMSRSPGELSPESFADATQAASYSDLLEIRRLLQKFATGNFEDNIEIRGVLGGALKMLQANLKHLTWQVQQVAQGDFSQRVDFMGDFSTAFNAMVLQLDQTVSELKEEIRLRRAIEKNLKQSIDRWNLVAECSRDGVWDVNISTKEAWYSPEFYKMLHVRAEKTPQDTLWFKWIHPEETEHYEFLKQMYEGTLPLLSFMIETRLRCPDGHEPWVRIKGMPVPGEEDEAPVRLIGVTSDISIQKETENTLAYQAMHDKLTGLPNRYLLDDRLRQHASVALRQQKAFIAVTLDLDDFKGVNDTWGHGAGDTLLVELSNRIRSCLRSTDTVARLGGDEFVFVYTCDLGQEEEATRHVMNRLYEFFKIPVDLGSVSYQICTSAGVSFFPRHTEDLKRLFEYADAALYRAKGNGKNAYEVWTPE